MVWPDQTWYQELTVEKMERIITEHLIGGQVVEEFVNPEPFRKIDAGG